jgi:predicted small secreted protein
MTAALEMVVRSSRRVRALIVALIAVALLTVTSPGCNTTAGIGRDVKSVGKGVEEAAEDAK